MQREQSVRISGLRTSMAVEGNQQADIISENKLNVDSERIYLGTGIALKDNQRTDTSNLVSEEKMITHSEINNAGGDASDGDLGVETSIGVATSQQADVSELSHGLSENGDDNIVTNGPRNVTEVPVASMMLFPNKIEGGDASIGINAVLCPSKGEDGDDQNGNIEIRTNEPRNEGGAELNSPPVLSKCSFAVDGALLSEENKDGQRESKRLAELRERKRSKYLSPPYVNPTKGLKDSDQENSTVPGDKEGNDVHGSSTPSPPASKSGGKRKKRKLSMKSVVSSGNLQEISASSGELLSGLHLAALDCLYSSENKHFDLTVMFFTIFRSSVFCDKSISKAIKKVTKKDTGVRNGKVILGSESKENASHVETKSEPKKRKTKEKAATTTSNLILDSLNNGNVTVAHSNVTVTHVPLIEVPKPTTPTPTPTPSSLDFSQKDNHTSSQSLDFAQNSKKTVFLSFENKGAVSMPDLSFGNKGTVSMPDLCFENKEAVSMPDLNGNSVNSNGLAAGSQPESPFFLTGMPGPKKRGRKKGTVVAKTNPDENPEKKKRRRKKKDGTYADGLPNINPHTPSTSMPISKPMSFEARLRSVGPAPAPAPAPATPASVRGHLNMNVSPGGRPGQGQAPSLDQMKKSLEMMTEMMEKSGDNLTPEMRGTLENEIRGLLKKVSAMSSSSAP